VASPLPLLPTSGVGSHGLPGWVWLAREALEAGRLGATDVRELIEDATQVALLDQERAGLDVLTTGEMGRVRFIMKEFPTDKELGAGVIDVKAFRSESPEDVAGRIRALLRYVAPERLWLNPDCGFWETPRGVTRRKLAALVEGARIVRAELDGR